MNRKRTFFDWLKKAQHRPGRDGSALGLRTTTVIMLAAGLLATSPDFSLRAQPVPVPALSSSAYQSTDFDPYFNNASGSKSQSSWETLIDQARILLGAQWEAQVDATIDAHVAAVGQSDYFSTTTEYRDYIRSELALQKQIAFAAWEVAADAQIEAERVGFLTNLSAAKKQTAIGESDDSIDEGQAAGATDPDADLTAQEKEWDSNFANSVNDGLKQFSDAIADVDLQYNQLMQSITDRDQEFEQNRLRIEAYEQTVRDNITATLGSMRSYLQSNGLFYEETCVQSNCTTDMNTLNQVGLNMESLINNVQGLLDNDAPLSQIAQQMHDYIEQEKLASETTQQDWFNRIEGWVDRRSNPFQADINPHGGTNPYHAYNVGNDIWWQNNHGARMSLIDWSAVNANQALSGFLGHAGGNSDALKAYIKASTGLWGEVDQISYADLCGTGQGGHGHTGQNRRAHRMCYFETSYNDGCGGGCLYASYNETFIHTNVGKSGKNKYWATSFAEKQFHLKVLYHWYDQNAKNNSDIWQGYVDDISPVFDHWHDNILPAIQNWEAQVGAFNSNHAAWKTEAATQRTNAQTARNTQIDALTGDRNKWLAQMQREYRDGRNQWVVIQQRAAAGQAVATNVALPSPTGIANLDSERVKYDEFIAASRAAVESRSAATTPLDFDAVADLNTAIGRASIGLRQLGLATAMTNRAAQQRERLIEQNIAMLESIDGVMQEVGDEKKQLKGYSVEVLDNGTIRATRQIHSGLATRLHGDGTSTSHYEAELAEQVLEIAPPAAVQLVETGSLFDAWDDRQVLSEFSHSMRESAAAGNDYMYGAQSALQDSMAYAAHKQQNFYANRSKQIADAVAYKARHSGGLGKALQAIATSMFSGGLSLEAATQQYMHNQVAGRVAEATGLPAGIFSAVLGGADWGSATEDYVIGEMESQVTQAIVKATGLPAGFISGMVSADGVDISGENMTAAFNNYADELFAEKLEEGTGIPGLAGFLKRTTIADRNAKKAAREAAKPKEEDYATMGATYVWRNADHNKDMGVALQATETVAGAAAIGTGWGTAAFAGYMAAKSAYKGYLTGDSTDTILKKAAVAGASSVINHYISKSGASVNLTYDEEGGFGGSVSASIPIKGTPLNVGGSLSFQEGQGITGGGLTAGVEFEGGPEINAGLNFAVEDGKVKGTGGSLSAAYTSDSGFGASGNINFNASGNVTSVGAELTFKREKEWLDSKGEPIEGASGTHTAGLGLTINADRSYRIRGINRVSGKDKYGIGVNSASASGSLDINYGATGGYVGHSSTQSAEFGFQTQGEKEAAMNERKAALDEKKAKGTITENELAELAGLEKRINNEGREKVNERLVAKLTAANFTEEEIEKILKGDAHDPAIAAKLKRSGFRTESSGDGSVLSNLGNGIKDAFRWLTGTYSTGAGMIDPETGEMVVRTCFVAGTLVLVLDDHGNSRLVEIEMLKLSYKAWACDQYTGKQCDWYPITHLHAREAEGHYRMKVSGLELGVTREHPINIAGSAQPDWRNVADAKVGQFVHTTASMLGNSPQSGLLRVASYKKVPVRTDHPLLAKRGPPVRIESLEFVPGKVKVYNFTVGGAHTYFVGNERLAIHVHNADALQYARTKFLRLSSGARKDYLKEKYGAGNLEEKEKEFQKEYEKAHKLARDLQLSQAGHLNSNPQIPQTEDVQAEIRRQQALCETDICRDAFAQGLNSGEIDGTIMVSASGSLAAQGSFAGTGKGVVKVGPGKLPVRGAQKPGNGAPKPPAKITASSSADALKLKNQLAAQEIAGGHAFEKHVLNRGEFPGIRTRAQFAKEAERIMNSPTTKVRILKRGRKAYWNPETGTIILSNPKARDGGTMFKPDIGEQYFTDVVE
ncbi:MAG: TIGR04388 family protein [bacterium]|nr:TIGR04388 family protein [bacterium]